jgi:hypothetical protein
MGNSELSQSQSQSHIATDSQSVSKSWYRAPSGLMTRYLILFDNCGLVSVGCPLWREDGSVFCICCWSLPAFLGPSPLGLATIFYCLRFQTSHFVASYDSQGHCGGIRPRLHMGDFLNYIKVKVTLRLTVSQSVSLGIEPHLGSWPDI